MKSPLRKVYFRWQLRLVRGLKNTRGMGLVEILMVAAMMGGTALVGTKVMNDFAERQNHGRMRDIRQRLFQEYYEIARNIRAIENSLAINNADIRDHVNGVSSPAIGTRRCMELRNQVQSVTNPNGVVVLPDVALVTQEDNLPLVAPNYCNLGGSYFDEKGGKNCRGGPCSAANARFHVYIVWIPVAPKKYDTDVVVRILNVPTKQGLLGGYDEISGKSITASQLPGDVWDSAVTPNRVWRNPGGGAYTGYFGLNTTAPQSRLEVIGDFMVTSGAASNRGNRFYINRDADLGLNIDIPDITSSGLIPGIDVNGSFYVNQRIYMDRDGSNNSWISHRGTLTEGQRVGLGINSTPGTGVVNSTFFQAGGVYRGAFTNAALSLYGDTTIHNTLNIYDSTGSRYGRMWHTGGNFHFEAMGGGNTYINWFSGAATNIGNGASAYGEVVANPFSASDIKFKKDITTILNPLEKIRDLRPMRFTFLKSEKRSFGFIAQDVEKVLPEMVSKTQHPTDGEYLTLNYSNFTALLVEGLKELKGSFFSKKTDLTKITTRQHKLKDKISSLERLNITAKRKLCARYPEEALCR